MVLLTKDVHCPFIFWQDTKWIWNRKVFAYAHVHSGIFNCDLKTWNAQFKIQMIGQYRTNLNTRNRIEKYFITFPQWDCSNDDIRQSILSVFPPHKFAIRLELPSDEMPRLEVETAALPMLRSMPRRWPRGRNAGGSVPNVSQKSPLGRVRMGWAGPNWFWS